VAQLGARFHGMEEVIGSIPIRSTKYSNNLDNAGALGRAFMSHPYFAASRGASIASMLTQEYRSITDSLAA
jgi:hypothetical protein